VSPSGGTFVHGGRTYAYAGFGRRFAAALLDTLFWLIAFSLFIPESAFEGSETAGAIAGLVLLTVWFNYFAFCEWRWGQTIGKSMLGLRVMAIDGGRLSWNAAAIRNLFRIVELPLALIGVDWAIVNRSPRRQRLGDRAADTLVVREPTTEPAPAPTPTPRPSSPPASELFAEATRALAGTTTSTTEHVRETSSDPGGGGGSDLPAGHPSEPGEEGMGVHRGKTVLSERDAHPLPPPEALDGEPQRRWPPATWGPGIAILGVLGALLAGLFLSIPAVAVDTDAGSEDGSSLSNILLQLGTVLGFLLVPLVLAATRPEGATAREVLDRLGFRRFAPSAFGWMAAAYGGYIAAAAVYVAIVGTPEQDEIADLFGSLPAKILLIVVCASIAEELCFRGFLYGGLRTSMGPVTAAVASSVIWGVLHAVTGISAVPVLVFFGIALALLYEKTGSVVPGILLHGVNNSLALLTL
jgi:uncharacterized protein